MVCKYVCIVWYGMFDICLQNLCMVYMVWHVWCAWYIWRYVCMYACRAYSTKLGHVCDFSEKGQKNVEKGLKRAKYLKIWAKM